MSPSLLEGFLTEPELARELKRCVRTIRRWTREPDGLPYTVIGKQRLHNRESVVRWLMQRERRLNPRRRP